MLEPVSALLVFLQGVASFLSPCVLPLIPAYLAMLGGAAAPGTLMDGKLPRIRLIFNTLAFVLGFTLVFALLGASATALGAFLNRNARMIAIFSGFLVILFGLVTTGILHVPFLERERRFDMSRVKGAGLLRPFLTGIAFSFGWTPCIGPVLASVMLLAGSAHTVWAGIGLLIVYALGLGLPFLLISSFLSALWKPLQALKKHALWIKRVSGAVLVVMGVLMITGTFSLLAQLGAPDIAPSPEPSPPVVMVTPSPSALAPEASAVPLASAPPADTPAPSADTPAPQRPLGESSLTKEQADALAEMLNDVKIGPVELSSLDGGMLSTDDFAGVRVINLLATWCPYCIEELPILQKVTSEMGVPLIGIDTFESGDAESVKKELRALLTALPAPFPILLDTTSQWGQELSPRGSVPVTLILDEEGFLRFYYPGAFQDEQDLRDLLDFMLYHLQDYVE